MLKVIRVSDPYDVVSQYDATNITSMVSVTFAEEGRTTVTNANNAFVNKAAGENIGLAGTPRTCTVAIRAEKAGLFPEGKTLEGHINREWLDVNPYPNARDKEGNELLPREFTFNKVKHVGFAKTTLAETMEDDTINFILEDVPSNTIPLKEAMSAEVVS